MTEKRVTLKQLGQYIRQHISASRDSTIIKGAHARDLNHEQTATLCMYIGKALISEVFGGTPQSMASITNRYLDQKKENELQEEKERELRDGEIDDDLLNQPTPLEPRGIGGFKYANRLTSKILARLEHMVDEGQIGQGQQAIAASKELLRYADNVKKDALTVMQAYEKQLLLLAEHMVEKFLPMIGEKIKNDFIDWKQQVSDAVTDQINSGGDPQSAWSDEMDRFARQFDRKKFEILFAESLMENPKTSEAFDMTTDLLENYGGDEESVYQIIEDDSAKVIKEALIQTRNDRELQNNNFDNI